ncbi:hypothetical protein K488DRAFT_90102 [Vararia minispora EC-137]|uniref:Uncharacterized protein n=1 Tax=Vararia minispora EC-137 TaxID=1314806 RepID=A0ACB8QA19_9AGAM|nr:hypothetical protein K488DRAFT_90102 [Vararia minispora EC-137]
MRNDSPDSSDADIRMAYHSIAQNGTLNWLLLSYGKASLLCIFFRPLHDFLQWAGGLKLLAAGSQGVPELRTHITDDNVYFAFFREEIYNSHIYATVAYIPEGISGLRRTRAISTSRTVQSWFKVSQAMLTLSSIDDLTSETLVQAVNSNQALNVSHSINRSPSDCFDAHKSLPNPPFPDAPARRSHSTGPDQPHSPLGSDRFWRPLLDFGDPAERARRRQEAHFRQIVADEIAAREEALRQERIKREKAEILKRHEEEDLQRRVSLEQELKRAAIAKAEKDEEERLAAEKRMVERELKKRMDAEKRIAEAQRIDEEEAKRQVEMAKLVSRASALQLRGDRLAGKEQVLLRGWMTIQNTTSLVWRRRWFELTETSMLLYDNNKSQGKNLDTIELTGRIKGVAEWSDGFEDLRAIPHSFAIIFYDDQEPLSVYMDSETSKTVLAGFLLTYV